MVDYSLARRSTLRDVFAGRLSTVDVCDAHPYLLRAARYHGAATDRDCPLCRHARLVEVLYTYGDCFREATNGRVRQRADLPELATEFADFTVYEVEVCQDCGWNHLTVSYVLGAARSNRARGNAGRVQNTRRAAEE